MRYRFSIILFFACLFINAQELPPVINYGPNEYGAGNQNWMISQGDDKNLYFANSSGLLEYNGEDWNLYPVPNKTVVRSVEVVGDRIYTGAYMEAGYWEKDEYGELVYTSLVPKFDVAINDGEQFWQIEHQDDFVIFRSFAGIYFYDSERNQVSKLANPLGKPITGLYKFENQIFFQLAGEGLFTIEKGEPQIVIPFEYLGERAIIHLFNRNNEISFVTGNSEFFTWNGEDLVQFNEYASEEIRKPNLLAALSLENGDHILGTVGSGIVQIGTEGKIINKITQNNILLNNTVLGLYLDKTGKIWAGLDYGISMVEPNSSFRSFQDNRGEIGTVYDSFEKDGDLYLGTNQGLYWKEKTSSKFSLIPGTKGQVWFVDEVDGEIFCGHNSGTFLINGGSAEKIHDRLGTWLVKELKEDHFILGHYNGISFLRREEGEIISIPMLPNFPHSSKFIQIGEDGDIWVSNEHKGVFKIRLNGTLSGIEVIKNYKFPNENGINSSIFKFNDKLYYSSKEKIYKYSKTSDTFTFDKKLNDVVAPFNRISGRMVSEEDRARLWGFAQKGIFYIEPGQLSEDYKLNFIYIDQAFRNIAVGYENVTGISEGEYLIGVANGYVRFTIPVQEAKAYGIRINKISISALDSVSRPVPMEDSGSFEYRYNNIRFNYSAPVHDKFQDPNYSHRLLGLSPNWSEWSDSPTATFENLSFGDYTFEVKARTGGEETGTATYQFTIERPFYLSNLAIAIYVILFGLMGFVVHLIYRWYHKKAVAENERELKMKNLEAEREIIKLRNEKLEQDMTNKNRELAVSTMSLIKKNEFLTNIKNELKESRELPKVKSVIRTIDQDISEEDNWKFFKKAFSNADKDFFKKIKSKHPELTSNDLKLCAYLRLNLSSKEIAPLLNISVKSVEIKRYRLRKKMDLDRETNLTDYILSL